MTLMNLFTKIAEKSIEFKLNVAYKESTAALSVFTKAKALLTKANDHLAKTEIEVTEQLNKLNKISLDISEEQARNNNYVKKINAILE